MSSPNFNDADLSLFGRWAVRQYHFVARGALWLLLPLYLGAGVVLGLREGVQGMWEAFRADDRHLCAHFYAKRKEGR